MSAPEIRLDAAFGNRLANSMIAIRCQLIETSATTAAASASPCRPRAARARWPVRWRKSTIDPCKMVDRYFAQIQIFRPNERSEDVQCGRYKEGEGTVARDRSRRRSRRVGRLSKISARPSWV